MIGTGAPYGDDDDADPTLEAALAASRGLYTSQQYHGESSTSASAQAYALPGMELTYLLVFYFVIGL
jgi:hypothetical protein